MTTEIVGTRTGLANRVGKVRESASAKGHRVVAEVRVAGSVRHGYATLTVSTDDPRVMAALDTLKAELARVGMAHARAIIEEAAS